MPEVTLAHALELCERALRLDLTLAEAERLWPDAPMDGHLAAVRGDLLFALEHVPESPRSPQGDPDRWRQMPDYGDVERLVEQLRARLGE